MHEHALRVALVVNELVTNAIKHAFPQGKGRISVRLTSDEDALVLEVADDGVANAKTESGGAGGKLITAMVRSMQGQVSKRVGPGTAFEVRVPLTQATRDSSVQPAQV